MKGALPAENPYTRLECKLGRTFRLYFWRMSWERVRERMAAAALRAGRKPEEITLLVVSKGQPPEKIQTLFEKGQRLFGENRVQALLAKKRLLPDSIAWHLIGPLQTNKVKAILPHIQLLHSLDREALVREVVKRASAPVPCLIQVKIAQEPTKHGVLPENLFSLVETVLAEPAIRLEGLWA